MNTAKIYLKDKLIHLEFCGEHITITASKILTDIVSVVEFDSTGYIVINTNYGEEYIDLEYEIEKKGLNKNILSKIKDIDKLEVIKYEK